MHVLFAKHQKKIIQNVDWLINRTKKKYCHWLVLRLEQCCNWDEYGKPNKIDLLPVPLLK